MTRAPRAGFRRFIGVALGGGRGKTTAVARLERAADSGPLTVFDAKIRHGLRGTGDAQSEPDGASYFRDDVLSAYLDRWVDEHTVVAIDAPLTLPPCLRCDLVCPGADSCQVEEVAWMRRHAANLRQRRRRDTGKPDVTPYTQRATEILLMALGLSPPEALGQGTGPLAARAQHLRARLGAKLRLQENLIEVHPRSTLTRMFGSRRESKARQSDVSTMRATRKAMLADLSDRLHFEYVWPELVVRNIHVFHAVVGALTGFGWAHEQWTVGETLAPPPRHGAGPADEAVAAAAQDWGFGWVGRGFIWIPPHRSALVVEGVSP